MARGESAKGRPHGPGIAIGAAFGVLCLASLTWVLTCVDLGASGPGSLWGPLPPSDPFAGATSALGELGWRDSERARAAYGAAVSPDSGPARTTLEATLRARGYVEAQPPDDARALDLPFEATVEALGGACGVVALLGLGTAAIHSIEGPDGVVPAADPSVVTLGACDAITIRALGAGRATLAVWHLPGLTPADAASTGVPADALLAHAEAEALWRARGWAPADALVRDEHASAATSGLAPPGAQPGSGCIAWTAVALGAGRAETLATSGTLASRDASAERALFGAFACADGTRSLTDLVDPGGDGFVVYWRAWGSDTRGPRRPGAPTELAPSVAALRIVDASDAPLPEPL